MKNSGFAIQKVLLKASLSRILIVSVVNIQLPTKLGKVKKNPDFCPLQ